MTDLFSNITPPAKPIPTKVGQANGEFLARLAMMPSHQRASVNPADFPHATPALIHANARFWGART